MGANMTPMMKKSGSTVFGVKMGLSRHVSRGTTRSVVAMHILPCLQSLLSERRICRPSVLSMCARRCAAVALTRRPLALCLLLIVAGWVLAGYRIRVFDLLRLRHGEEFPRDSAGRGGGERSAVVAGGWKLRDAADERLSLAKPRPKLAPPTAPQGHGPRILHIPADGLRNPSSDSGSEQHHIIQVQGLQFWIAIAFQSRATRHSSLMHAKASPHADCTQQYVLRWGIECCRHNETL
jgi:hypothetical protein